MIFDLATKFRTDTRFTNRYIDLQKRYAKLNAEANKNPKFRPDSQKALLDVMKHVEFNMGPFLPEYFPAFPRSGHFSLKDYPYAYIFHNCLKRTTLVNRGSRQIAKTTNLTAGQVMRLYNIPNYKIFAVTPHSDQLTTYANAFKDAIEAYRYYQVHPGYRQNLYYREVLHPNKSVNKIKFSHVLTSVTSTRGNSAEELSIDEGQDFDGGLETQLVSLLDASKEWGTYIITGTSLTTDSFLEEKYLQTTQSTWAIKCHHCGHVHYTDDVDTCLGMVKPQGPSCVKCGGLLQVRNGTYIHRNPEMLEARIWGFHTPQIIVPANVEDPFRWNSIYLKSLDKTRQNQFVQEVFGIATEEGSRELTTQNLQDICTLGPQSKLVEATKNRRYQYVIAGFDWGGSEHRPDLKLRLSYTAMVILGVTLQGRKEIVYMNKYSGMNYETVLASAMSVFNDLRGFALASDAGGGDVYNKEIHDKHMPFHRHWVFRYTGPTAKLIAPLKGGSTYNTYTLNKTEALSRLILAIKSGDVLCYDWLESSPYLSDVLNLVRAPHENVQTGTTYFTYRKAANRSDDILQALNLAYHLACITIGEPLFEDKAQLNEAQNLLMGRTRAMHSSSEVHAGRTPLTADIIPG